MKNQYEKCEALAALHKGEDTFIIPNPWDIGSARVLQGLGFKALATTSSGLAHCLGRKDGEVTLEEKLAHCRLLCAATDIPISADFENGFADSPERVAKNVMRLAETGVAGCSIEDFGRDSKSMYDFALAVERVQAAVEAVTGLEMPFQLTARAENLLRGVNDVEDTVRRLRAYEATGAHVTYAPGIRSLEQLKVVTGQLDKQFNVLAAGIPGASVAEFAAAGAKRISIGGALNWLAVDPVIKAGKEMLQDGTFNWLARCTSASDVAEITSG